MYQTALVFVFCLFLFSQNISVNSASDNKIINSSMITAGGCSHISSNRRQAKNILPTMIDQERRPSAASSQMTSLMYVVQVHIDLYMSRNVYCALATTRKQLDCSPHRKL